MKKLVSLVLALCLLLSVMAVASAEDKVTINVWRKCFNLAQPDQDQVKKVQDAINAYLADKSNVQIVLTDIAGEYEDPAKLALANNELDILWTASWESIIGTNDLVPANAVADITDYLPGTALYGSMAEGQWEATKYNGRNYFIPVYKDNVEGYDFMFRKELVDQFGWEWQRVHLHRRPPAGCPGPPAPARPQRWRWRAECGSPGVLSAACAPWNGRPCCRPR